MGMFNTFGKTADSEAGRKENTLRKLNRLNKALRHEEPDRVPISDFFWGGLPALARSWGLRRARRPMSITTWTGFRRCRIWTRGSGRSRRCGKRPKKWSSKTGYGTVMRKRFDFPMPEMRAWETDTMEKLERVEFDDPRGPATVL